MFISRNVFHLFPFWTLLINYFILAQIFFQILLLESYAILLFFYQYAFLLFSNIIYAMIIFFNVFCNLSFLFYHQLCSVFLLHCYFLFLFLLNLCTSAFLNSLHLFCNSCCSLDELLLYVLQFLTTCYSIFYLFPSIISISMLLASQFLPIDFSCYSCLLAP